MDSSQDAIPFASLRTPGMSSCHNNADLIESQLAKDGHTKWGFVIYRCDYEDDEQWAEVLSRLQTYIKDDLEFYNGLDMLDSMLFTVVEDKATLNDASTAVVREHFNQWRTAAPEREEGQGKGPGGSSRYKYCIQIDAKNVASILDDPNPEGFVNLISADWLPARERVLRLASEHPERHFDTNPYVEVMEPIEGCTERDVGWMHFDAKYVLVGEYAILQDVSWETEYRRPPEVLSG